jgi:hypothetical protein
MFAQGEQATIARFAHLRQIASRVEKPLQSDANG